MIVSIRKGLFRGLLHVLVSDRRAGGRASKSSRFPRTANSALSATSVSGEQGRTQSAACAVGCTAAMSLVTRAGRSASHGAGADVVAIGADAYIQLNPRHADRHANMSTPRLKRGVRGGREPWRWGVRMYHIAGDSRRSGGSWFWEMHSQKSPNSEAEKSNDWHSEVSLVTPRRRNLFSSKSKA